MEEKKCLIYEMPLIKKDKRPTLNSQTDSLPPKSFRLSNFISFVVHILIETFSLEDKNDFEFGDLT